MTSQVEICNIALSNIRAQSINSIDEAGVNAQYCKLKYEFLRKFMLRSSPWNFARKQAVLAALTDELFDWVYAYQYPSDCLRINKLMSSTDRLSQSSDGNAVRPEYYDNNPLNDYANRRKSVEYAVMNFENNKVIGANESELWIDYQIDIADPNKFDDSFIMAFSWYLSAEIAVPIIGGDNGRAERSNALKIYQATLADAMAMDSNEQNNGDMPESELILARS